MGKRVRFADENSLSLSEDISDDEIVITADFTKHPEKVQEESLSSCSSKPRSRFLRKKPVKDLMVEEEDTSEPRILYNLVSEIDEESLALEPSVEEEEGANDYHDDSFEMEETSQEEECATLERERAEKDLLRAELEAMKEQMTELEKERAHKDSLQAAEMKTMKEQMVELTKERVEKDSLRAEVKRMKEQMADLEKERAQKDDLRAEVKLMKEQVADLEKVRAQKDNLHAELKLMKEQVADLEKVRAQKDDLHAELKLMKEQVADLEKVRAQKDNLHAELKLMKEQVADLKKSQTAQKQQHKEELQETIAKMTAQHEEDNKLIEGLKKDLKDRKETLECEKVKSSEMNELKGQVIKLQEECSEKDGEIKSLESAIRSLQDHIETKDEVVNVLQDRMLRCASYIKRQEEKYCNLETEYRYVASKENKRAAQVKHLTRENQQLSNDNKRLQSELEAAKKEQSDAKQLQEVRETCSRLTEAIRKEKDWSRKAYRRMKAQKEEIFEKTLALEKSEAAEKLLRSTLSDERQRFEQMDLQRQASIIEVAVVSNQLKDASASSEGLMKDIQTLKMENQDIRVKVTTTQMDYDRLEIEHRTLVDCYNEMLSKKNEAIAKNETTIATLQGTVDDLTAQQSQRISNQTEIEDALKEQKNRNDELQRTVNRILTALENERSTCEQYRVELKEALTKQMQLLEDKQNLAVAVQKAQISYFRLQDHQVAETNIAFRHFNDTEGARALHHLQQGYTDLRTKLKQEKLQYTRGNHRPEFCTFDMM